MNSQPFELRRLHAAAWLFFYALVCFFLSTRGRDFSPLFALCGIFFLAGSLGAPFKRGILVVGVVFWFLVIVFAILAIWTIYFAEPIDF